MNRPFILASTLGIYTAVRMLIGVYHAIFLLSTGVTLAQLALLQLVFSVVMLLFNFPCAVIADKYSHKYSVIIGVFFTAIFYLFSLQAPDMYFLVIAQIFYSIGLGLCATAINGWLYYSLEDKKDSFSQYAHLSHRVGSLGSVFTGMIGIATIYFSGSFFVGYIISAIAMVMIIFILIWVPEKKIVQQSEVKPATLIQNTYETLWIFKNTLGGKYYIIQACLLTAGLQVVLHFWQPIILNNERINYFDNYNLLVLMLCHVGAFSSQYFSNFILSKYHLADNKYKNYIKYFSFFSGGMCIALLLLVNVNYIYLAIIAFSLIHGFICTVPIGAQSLFLSELKQGQETHVSSIAGAIAFSGRIFSILVLSVISFLPENLPPVYYLVLPAITFALCGFIMIKWMSQVKKLQC
ncbi:MFS transporter [Bartonella sp. DGB1]|uniref:MFS transporter n=1 Tax=Bartonella sp. DGB1 TaxID=3239807 RepID=UPI003523DDAD